MTVHLTLTHAGDTLRTIADATCGAEQAAKRNMPLVHAHSNDNAMYLPSLDPRRLKSSAGDTHAIFH